MNFFAADIEQQQQQQQKRRAQPQPQPAETSTNEINSGTHHQDENVDSAQADTKESSTFQQSLETVPTVERSAVTENITTASATSIPFILTEQQRQQEPRLQQRLSEKGSFVRRRCFFWYHRFSNHSPRIFAFIFGFIAPIIALVILASACGYLLALLEAPQELDRNDYVLEHQMRLLVETSVYTNLTQALPRICLSLYFLNASVDEFLTNVSTLLDGPPTEEDMTDYVEDVVTNATLETDAEDLWEYVVEGSDGSNSSDTDSDQFSINSTLFSLFDDAIVNISATTATNDTAPTITATSGTSTWSTTATATIATDTTAMTATSNTRDQSNDSHNTSTAFNITIEIDPEQLQDNAEDSVQDIVEYLDDPFFEIYHFYAYKIQQIMHPDALLSESGFNDTTRYINLTDLALFVNGCGEALSPVIDKMFASLSMTANRATVSQLEFAWNRCSPNGGMIPIITSAEWQQSDASLSTAGLYGALLSNFLPANWTQPTFTTMGANSSANEKPNALSSQTATYRKQWEQQRRFLYITYLEEEQQERSYGSNTSSYDMDPAIWHRINAFERSLKDASGGGGCVPNIPASCWFFFTVMTTIGYGNASPESFWGRLLVFTMGFISMILFGLASTRAAYVITSILDDLLVNLKLRVLTRPWIQLFLWGLLYYVWMLLIASVYSWWRVERLGEDGRVPLSTAYWFSYISTTTVGFGDYYLEPEVIVGVDCIVFPIIFLLGFSVLASFLTKLSRLVTRPFQDRPSLTEHFRTSDKSRESRLSLTQSQNRNSCDAKSGNRAVDDEDLPVLGPLVAVGPD